MKIEEVKLMRLISGEDLIAEIIDDDVLPRTHMKIKNPLKIVVVPQPNPNTPPQIGLVPWQPFAETEIFDLRVEHVLSIVPPIEQFLTQYQQAFSKVILPNSGKKLVIPGV